MKAHRTHDMSCCFLPRLPADSYKQPGETSSVQGTVCAPQSCSCADPSSAGERPQQPQQHETAQPCSQPARSGFDGVHAASACAGFPAAGRRPEPGAGRSAGRRASAAQARRLA